jgi:hypothetical protein
MPSAAWCSTLRIFAKLSLHAVSERIAYRAHWHAVIPLFEFPVLPLVADTHFTLTLMLLLAT